MAGEYMHDNLARRAYCLQVMFDSCKQSLKEAEAENARLREQASRSKLVDDECIKLLIAEVGCLREALSGLLNRYVDLVNSGDAGFWNPESEDEVIAARKALRGAE